MNSKLKLNIYELCKSVSIIRMKSLGFFNLNDAKQASKYNICFRKIHSGEIYDDRTAREVLGYTNAATFQRFRHRFTARVKSYLFLIDAHKVKRKEEEELHKEMWREVALAKILQKSGQTANSRAIYAKVYPIAKEHEFLDIEMVILPILTSYFAYIKPNKKLYAYYQSELDACRQQEQKSYLCAKYYDAVSSIHIFNDLRDKVSVPDLCAKYYSELKLLFEPNDYSTFRIKAYQIAIFGFQTADRHEDALRICTEAHDYINQKKNVQSIYKYMALKDLMNTHLKMNQLDNALTYLSEIESLGLTYNFNYFSLQSQKFQIYACQKRYDELYILTQHILSIRELSQFPLRVEQWKIKEAFVQFLCAVNLVSKELQASLPLKPFRMRRFINQIEMYSTDKRGSNISIQVVQLLFYLKEKKYGKVAERLETLTQYTYRYLRKDDTLRSNCFIKMLLKLPEAEYNAIRTKRYVNKYWKRLQGASFKFSLQSTETEVIPYEHLWGIIIEMIDNTKTK